MSSQRIEIPGNADHVADRILVRGDRQNRCLLRLRLAWR